jgi:hypothetical protein
VVRETRFDADRMCTLRVFRDAGILRKRASRKGKE